MPSIRQPSKAKVLYSGRAKPLQASAHAYQEVVALRDVFTYTVTTPSAALAPKTLKITLGSGDQAALEDPLIEAIPVNGNLFVTKGDAPGKYVVQPYSGDFAKALDRVANHEFEKARFYSGEERKERDKLRQLREKYRLDNNPALNIRREDIERAVSKLVGMPIEAIRQSPNGNSDDSGSTSN
jgi:hypothetical protein